MRSGLLILPLTVVLGCPSSEKDDSAGPGTDDSGTALEAVCTDPVAPSCVDEMILDLTLHDDKISDGAVTTTVDGEDFLTAVDASAGGYNEAANNPWVYVRFTATGAERLDIDDESALEDMTWDMSLRRFILRLNGGDSGPSCVGAAAMIGFDYADLTDVAEGVAYKLDDFYTDDCTFINDSSGLEGSPQVALSQWWTYPGCVATSETPFLIRQADGHVIKLVVESYYDEGQDTCNETGATTGSGGYFTLRWRYLQ